MSAGLSPGGQGPTGALGCVLEPRLPECQTSSRMRGSSLLEVAPASDRCSLLFQLLTSTRGLCGCGYGSLRIACHALAPSLPSNHPLLQVMGVEGAHGEVRGWARCRGGHAVEHVPKGLRSSTQGGLLRILSGLLLLVTHMPTQGRPCSHVLIYTRVHTHSQHHPMCAGGPANLWVGRCGAALGTGQGWVGAHTRD